MLKRAESAMIGLYLAGENPAIAALVNFAAQNSGIDARNYFQSWRDHEGAKAYRQETRQISNDWRDFKDLLETASAEGVTDQQVIAEAPHAFSGRLSWKADHWEYCTGQYFPTEYRRAACVLLDYAIRAVRQARPPQRAQVHTIADLKTLNARNGGCWFERSNMKFFGTIICSEIIGGAYFITSEQPPHGKRQYSVRSFNDEGDVNTVGEFCAYDSRADALAALRAHIKAPVAA